MVPNPWEAGHYTIMNDLGDDAFIRNFDKYKASMVWAPLVPPDKTSQLDQLLTQAVQDIFGGNTGATNINNTGTGSLSLASYKQAIIDALIKYVAALRTGGGEGDPYTTGNPPPADAEHEGINVVMLVDPFSRRPTDAGPPGLITVDTTVMLN